MKVEPIQRISLSQLIENPRSPNKASENTLTKLQKHIENTGFCPALVVTPMAGKPGFYEIVDGHQRLKVTKRLGMQDVECQVVMGTTIEINMLLATLNRLHGEDNPRLRAELIKDLTEHIPLPSLAELLPESKDELRDLLSLLEQEEFEKEAVLQELINKEEQSLPTILNFMVSKENANCIQQAIELSKELVSADSGENLASICKFYLSFLRKRG